MKPYAQYCPIAKTAEILGDRWSILILRDMLVGTSRFNELARGLPGISRSLLVKRLTHLRASGLVVRTGDGYVLTQAGLDLRPLVFSMAEWGAKWAFPEPSAEDLDPDLLVWWIHGQIDRAGDASASRVVVQIEFRDPSSWYWLVIEPDDVSVCLTDPGFEIDLVMRSSLRTMYSVWMGFRDLHAALLSGEITLEGPNDLVRRFPTWLRLCPVNPAVQAARLSR